MPEVIKLVIPGKPHGKERPRLRKKAKHPYTPEKTAAYEQLIQVIYRQAYGNDSFPKGVPLDMRIKAFLPIAKSDSAEKRALKLSGKIRPTVTPDWDNIGKIVSDALNTVAYHDDAQVVDTQTRKFYSDRPRVEITITKAKEI